MTDEEILELLKSFEYISYPDELINELTPEYYRTRKFCPDCGYKEQDGHWRSCKLGLAIEKLKETEGNMK